MKTAAVIMVGGSGTRFWPYSRKRFPKQYLPLFEGKSLFQLTVQRLSGLMPMENIFIVTNQSQLQHIKNQVPDIVDGNIILEPQGRNTAPAIGLAALAVSKKMPGAVMVVCPADHLIKDEQLFHKEITGAARLARQTGCLLTIGIKPDKPNTGYGYIEAGEKIASYGTDTAYEVCSFCEKPDLNTAERYLEAGNYWWNSGIFVWQTTVILEELSTHCPAIYLPLMELGDSYQTDIWQEELNKIFPELPAVSIDYGLLEKSKNILTIQGSFDWDDMGSWNAFSRYLEEDNEGNRASGNVLPYKSSSNIVVTGSNSTLCALSGVHNLIIVQTDDVLMICDRRDDQAVKELVGRLSEMEDGENYI